jgi:hypothetical protein
VGRRLSVRDLLRAHELPTSPRLESPSTPALNNLFGIDPDSTIHGSTKIIGVPDGAENLLSVAKE